MKRKLNSMRSWPSFTWIIAFVLLMVFPTAAPQAQLSSESLVQSVPAHFKLGSSTAKPDMNMTEMIPENETVQNWSEVITTQIFFKLAGVAPADFLRRLGEQWVGDCAGTTHGDIRSGNANGYPVSMLLLSCPRNPMTGKPEPTLFRAIQGRRSLYVIQYAFRHGQDAELTSKAARYLGTINVCDAGTAAHPCPDLTANGFKKM